MKKNEFFLDNLKNWRNNFSWLDKFFLQNYWYFDISTKTNGSLDRFTYLPLSYSSVVTLPLVSSQNDNTGKLKFIIQSLKILKLFTFQKSFIKKKILLQQQKKKNSCYILQSKTQKQQSHVRFLYYVLTILPYLKVSYGIEWTSVLTDEQGSINFYIDDIAFFSNLVEEKIIGWDWQIVFSFTWQVKEKTKWSVVSKFFLIPFIQNMFFWLAWSAIGLVCNWGHGGWLNFSKFSKTILYSNKIFFKKNFKF